MSQILPGMERQLGSFDSPSPNDMDKRHPNRGFMHDRTKYNYDDGRENLEKVFADAWEEENVAKSWLNHGNGVLQDLLFKSSWQAVHWLTPVERWVAATAIQWLGSNCGFSFLREVLKKGGYVVVKTDTWDKINNTDQSIREEEFKRQERVRKSEQDRIDKIKNGPNPWAKRMITIAR